MATFNIQLPNVRQLDWNDKRTQNILLDFFSELTEKLNYTLNNMDLTNFDRTTYIDLSRAASYKDPEALVEKLTDAEKEERADLEAELRNLIWTTANNIEEKYDSKLKFEEEQLSSVYSFVADAVSDYGTLQDAWESYFSQTAQGFEAKVTRNVSGQIEDTANNLTAFQNRVTSYLTFDTSGLTVSKENSPFKTVITNARLSFKQGNTEVAYISENELHIENAKVKEMSATSVTIENTLRIGNFVWKPETNGSMSLVFDEITEETEE